MKFIKCIQYIPTFISEKNYQVLRTLQYANNLNEYMNNNTVLFRRSLQEIPIMTCNLFHTKKIPKN